MYITSFIQYISTEKRYSRHTAEAYKNDLNQFFSFIEETFELKNPGEITPSMVRSWIFEMANHSISSKTINRKLSTLKTYFRFLRKNNLTSNNPLNNITSPKTNKRLPEFVNQEQMDFLLDDFFFDDTFIGKRDRLIIEILYFTGIRLSELIQIKDKDIDLHQKQIKVLGKRNKERIIPFGNTLLKSLIEYTTLRNKEVIRKEGVVELLITQKGEKVYKKLVYRVVNTYLSRVSTLKKTSPHVLRHTFATHMLNNGAELNTIKEILGHASLAATQVYTHNTIEKLKTIYKLAHPRA